MIKWLLQKIGLSKPKLPAGFECHVHGISSDEIGSRCPVCWIVAGGFEIADGPRYAPCLRCRNGSSCNSCTTPRPE